MAVKLVPFVALGTRTHTIPTEIGRIGRTAKNAMHWLVKLMQVE